MIRWITSTELVFLILTLILYTTPILTADQIFYDNFEDKAFTDAAWEQGAEPLDWELSADYNHSPGGAKCIKTFSKDMQVWGDMWYMFEQPLKPAHVRIWFYEKGWKNKVKVDQQYLLLGDDDSSTDFCQIGQTGNPDYDGHYCIYTRNPDAFHVSKASSEEERWVKMDFVLYEDGTAKVFVDDIEEFEFPLKWPSLDRVGLSSYGRDDRGGVPEGYWDDLEVFDTEEAPQLSVAPGDKLTVTWGLLKD